MPFILPANTLSAGGYDVANSLRFNSASADYISKTYGTPTSTQKWTASFWMKRSELGREQHIFGGTSPSQCYFVSNDTLRFADTTAGTNYYTTQVFRDTSAWYHFVIAVDTTLGTAGDRARIYVNGSEITSFSTETNATQNNNSAYNVASTLYAIGRYNPSQSSNYYFGGYYSEICFIDGSQLAADSFGEFDEDSGIWKPINVSGLTFGNNGYYLEFKQAGTGTDANGMGADTSGNTNHFAVNNLTAVDQSTDTCTNNFSTLNPLFATQNPGTLTEGNTIYTSSTTAWGGTGSTFGLSQGKWYWEGKIKFDNPGGHFFGVIDETVNVNNNPHQRTGSTLFYGGGQMYKDGSGSGSYGTFSNGDVMGFALNLDDNVISIYKNGSAFVTNFALSTTRNTLFVWVMAYNSGADFVKVNFGGSPPFAISSSNADGNGYGNFEHAPPSGYYSICSKNLAEYG